MITFASFVFGSVEKWVIMSVDDDDGAGGDGSVEMCHSNKFPIFGLCVIFPLEFDVMAEEVGGKVSAFFFENFVILYFSLNLWFSNGQPTTYAQGQQVVELFHSFSLGYRITQQ